MYWVQIAKACMQLVAKAVPPRNSAADANSERDGSNPIEPAPDDIYEETRMTSYTPDNHDRRDESSLHLSC